MFVIEKAELKPTNTLVTPIQAAEYLERDSHSLVMGTHSQKLVLDIIAECLGKHLADRQAPLHLSRSISCVYTVLQTHV